MKLNRSIKIISLILVVAILLSMISLSSITASAVQLLNENDSADNALQNIRTDDDFADDTILVILTNQVSINCDSFTINDFAEVNPIEIKNLSEPKEQQIQTALQTISNNFKQSNYHITEELSEINEKINEFNQVLQIKLSTPGKDNVLNAIKELEKREDVLYAGPDYYWTYSSETSGSSAFMLNFSEQWAYSHIQLDLAWEAMENMELSSTPIRIGVIDSGIDASHLELLNVNSNDSDTYGDNTVRGATVDSYGHGTKVAGIIKGVANNVELISLKVSESWIVNSSDVYEALISLDSSIPIINFSLSWKNSQGEILSTNYDKVIEDALNGYDGLIVCAAGNSGASDGTGADIDNDTNNDYYPVQHNIPHMIVVGASTSSDGVRSDSNYGDDYVDVFAPGENLYTTTNSGGYTNSEGMTSMATPFVTGLAAMLLMVNDRLTPEMIIEIITSTVDTEDSDNPNNGDSIGDLEDACSSNGRINAYEAILMAETYPTCDHEGDLRYGLNNASTHKVICNDCNAVISTEAHGFTYTSINVDRHSVYCAECSYSVTEDHDLYIYSVYNDVYTIKCRECSYSISCNCDREYVDDGASGHYVDCLDGCFSEFEPHTYELTGTYNSSGHEIECVYCYYSEYADHDLYMYSAAPEDYVVKCHNCSYTVECWESPEYYGNSSDGHWVDCPCGCYSFFEAHAFSYSNTEEGRHDIECADCGYLYSEDCSYICSGFGDLYNHTLECSVCGDTDTEPHDWIRVGTKYRCLVCGRQETIIPTDVMSLSDEELELLLSSMSDEELDQFIALLPEDALARVTAILPPENDDELLTE